MEKEGTKKKMCWMATLSSLCLLSLPVVWIVAWVIDSSGIKVDDWLSTTVAIFVGILLVASPILAIFALLKISRSENTLSGRSYAILTLGITTFALILMAPAVVITYRSIPYRLLCGTNLSGIGKALLVYTNDTINDQLPDAYKWCDLLVMYADVSPDNFRCQNSDAIYGESSYALNKEVIGMKMSEIPPDMVLLFETNYGKTKSKRDFLSKDRGYIKVLGGGGLNRKVYKDRWNQVGGPELLSVENHDFEGCNILFGDMHCKFEKTSNLSSLRWKLNGKVDFTVPVEKSKVPIWKDGKYLKPIGVFIIGLIAFITASLIICKYWQVKHIKLVIFLIIASGGAGAFLGAMSEDIYVFKAFHHTGMISGGILGVLAGICYAIILVGILPKIKQKKCFNEYATAMGMLTGIICSTFVHLILMIVAAEPLPFGIMAGMGFGIFAGGLLGRISSGFISSNDAILAESANI